MMKTPWTVAMFTFACLAPALHAGKVEADFNDLNLGDTRTSGHGGSPNNGVHNTGRGFATGGDGEYNNGTGVVQFQAGDLAAPAGVQNFRSEQKTPSDPAAAGLGVVFTSDSIAAEPFHTRMQERKFATALTGSQIWFSFLFKLKGPAAQGQVFFNAPATTDGGASAGAFGISLGHPSKPGAVAINLDPAQTPNDVPNGSQLLYYDGTKGVETVNSSAVTAHLIIGRITYNPAGADIIDIWLDPADASNLADASNPAGTAPTLTATSDEIPAGGLFSVAFEGTRNLTPVLTGSTYTSGGQFYLDHFRISDDADGLDFVTGNIENDPKLVIDSTSPTTSLNFRGVYGTGSPVTAAPRTITLRNTGTNNPITINSIGFQAATAVFNLSTEATLPVTLAPGQTTSFTVGGSSNAFGVTHTATLAVNTSVTEQNMTFPVSATFFTSGTRLTTNPGFETNTDGWLSDNFNLNTPASRVTPGAIGSAGMAYLKGMGVTGAPDNFSQTMINGAADWEMTFYFSPLDASVFPEYHSEGNAPESNDRTFQVVIQSNNTPPIAASGTEGSYTNANNGNAALINLAYLPANDQGFSVFNGSAWESLELPLITGSIDANKDGNLRSANGDSVNFYLVRIKGTGFGTSAARYSISVSQPNSVATAATASDLAIWSSNAGTDHTPGSFTFPTGDISRSGGLTTSYWIDEVSFYAKEAADPDFSVIPTGEILSHNGVTKSGAISITNTGFTQNLVISGVSFNTNIATSPQAFPLTIPPGSTHSLPVNINPANFTNGNNAARHTITVNSTLPTNPNRSTPFTCIGTTDANMVGNWNFNIDGPDPFTDWDTWAGWVETSTATASRDVTGLLDGTDSGGTGKAAYLGNNAVIRGDFGGPASDFVVEFPFALKATTTDYRMFNVLLHTVDGRNINIRYRNDVWQCFHEGSGWQDVITGPPIVASTDGNNDGDLADAGDVKNVHKFRLTGTGWGTPAATYRIEILDAADQPFAASDAGLAFFQGGIPTAGAISVTFQAQLESCPGYWVDDVSVRSLAPPSTPELRITGISGGPGTFILHWDSQGTPVTVERSTTLLPMSWEEISINDQDGTHTDSSAPAGRAFYRVKPVATP
ncbi:MAG: hypothetical protein KF712_01985 [Akkermansiaceae bacterium]|nr:hypothetical protein [Akkermansiaceae bacterium]